MKTPTLLLIAGLALVGPAFAVDPPPDGGYPRRNTAEGEDALLSLTTGSTNTAIGYNALASNTTGSANAAAGANALRSNTTGTHNTAVGEAALFRNTTANSNTANGFGALFSNTTGNTNNAIGRAALYGNTTGYDNVANGAYALQVNTTGFDNTATGVNSLLRNSIGQANAGYGSISLNANTTGGANTGIGHAALLSNTTGSSNIALGSFAGSALTTGDSNIDIGNEGIPAESFTIRIGSNEHRATYIAAISGTTVAGGVGVIIDTNGHLGTVTSSARYKKNIHPMNDASDKILSLHPVTFEYKEDLDPQAIPQFGLVAEDVANVDPDLVAKDEQGKPYTVRYEAVNAMLLNEFLKEHKKVEELEEQLQQMAARLDAKGL